jgi:Zn-finger nucleic acid-binding protein
MNCPVCVHVQLAIAERQGVEVDYCPQCRGVWLDRGELDKIIERAATAPGHGAVGHAPPLAAGHPAHRPSTVELDEHGRRRHHDDDDDDDDDQYRRRTGHDRRRKSFLKDLFDF